MAMLMDILETDMFLEMDIQQDIHLMESISYQMISIIFLILEKMNQKTDSLFIKMEEDI